MIPITRGRDTVHGSSQPQLAAGRDQRLRECRGQLARVDRVIVGDLEGETERGRERRLEPPCLAREQPVNGQTEGLAQLELARE